MVPYINIHTHKQDSEHLIVLNVLDIPGWHEDSCQYSYGIHPWNIDKVDLDVKFQILADLCLEKKLIAVGEIGIDRAIQIPIEIQSEVFKKQLAIAKQHGLPVIIHCVRAWSDILAEKKSRKHNTPWILHGFAGNLQTANQLIQNGIYLSFGIKLIQSQKLQETFKQIPLEFIFFETDDLEIRIEDIYFKAAELYDICIDELKVKINQNFIKVFGEQWVQNG
jgi:TatD DNase family protein